jgi:hypothetical protein
MGLVEPIRWWRRPSGVMMKFRWLVGVGSLLLGSFMVLASPTGASTNSYPPIPVPRIGGPLPCHDASIPGYSAGQAAAVEKRIDALVGQDLSSLGQCAHGQLLLTLTPGSEAMAKHRGPPSGPRCR